MQKDYQIMANAVRSLAIDMVSTANSGHPGLPLGFADVATVLFSDFLKFNPADAKWFNRDRFILSAGHGSALLYALFYLNEYPDIDLDDLKHFRQLDSVTAGHPEYGLLEGIETTTGPLGQGFGTAVGMALAERMLNARFGNELINHKTYCVVGDGCLMEGIGQEAISMAGNLQLQNLIVLWDNNEITIDGKTSLATSDDILQRFSASHWQTIAIDGHNYTEIHQALTQAQQATQPTLIACRTHIGYGSPKEGSSSCHGSPLKPDELLATKEKLHCPTESFAVADAALEAWQQSSQHNLEAYQQWKQYLQEHKNDPMVQEFHSFMNRELPESWREKLDELKLQAVEEKPKLATRQTSQKVLEVLTATIPQMIGGSADLTGSVGTKTEAVQVNNPISAGNYGGRYIEYGIREHLMGAMENGLALHGFLPYAGTFMVFSDYMKTSIRLSALMHQQVIYVLTHDSIAVGEDGPTHQPVEQLVSLRATPNLQVFRPCDLRETIECYELALDHRQGPSAMILSRQGLPYQDFNQSVDDNRCALGAYVLNDNSEGNPNIDANVVLMASGSEVEIALGVQKLLQAEKISSRVISCPCIELFLKQPQSYQDMLLGGRQTLRVAIEAATCHSWGRLLDRDDLFCGMQSFGASGKCEDVYKRFALTPEAISAIVLLKLEKLSR